MNFNLSCVSHRYPIPTFSHLFVLFIQKIVGVVPISPDSPGPMILDRRIHSSSPPQKITFVMFMLEEMGVSWVIGVPQKRWMVHFMENPTKIRMITRACFLFQETPKWWQTFIKIMAIQIYPDDRDGDQHHGKPSAAGASAIAGQGFGRPSGLLGWMNTTNEWLKVGISTG